MSAVIVIPARGGSSRFPRKPLAKILGKSLIERVWETANCISGVSGVYVASDDLEICRAVQSFGGNCIMTSSTCLNGTERVWEAIEKLESQPSLVLNLQGDAVLTPPWMIQSVLDEMIRDPKIGLGTPAVRLSQVEFETLIKSRREGRTSGTLVVFNSDKKALYFSKAVIPFVKGQYNEALPVHRHVGLYGYRYEVLKHYVKLKPTQLEEQESLEQLRALENGIPIHIILSETRGRSFASIDHLEDLEWVEQIILREGELISS